MSDSTTKRTRASDNDDDDDDNDNSNVSRDTKRAKTEVEAKADEAPTKLEKAEAKVKVEKAERERDKAEAKLDAAEAKLAAAEAKLAELTENRARGVLVDDAVFASASDAVKNARADVTDARADFKLAGQLLVQANELYMELLRGANAKVASSPPVIVSDVAAGLGLTKDSLFAIVANAVELANESYKDANARVVLKADKMRGNSKNDAALAAHSLGEYMDDDRKQYLQHVLKVLREPTPTRDGKKAFRIIAIPAGSGTGKSHFVDCVARSVIEASEHFSHYLHLVVTFNGNMDYDELHFPLATRLVYAYFCGMPSDSACSAAAEALKNIDNALYGRFNNWTEDLDKKLTKKVVDAIEADFCANHGINNVNKLRIILLIDEISKAKRLFGESTVVAHGNVRNSALAVLDDESKAVQHFAKGSRVAALFTSLGDEFLGVTRSGRHVDWIALGSINMTDEFATSMVRSSIASEQPRNDVWRRNYLAVRSTGGHARSLQFLLDTIRSDRDATLLAWFQRTHSKLAFKALNSLVWLLPALFGMRLAPTESRTGALLLTEYGEAISDAVVIGKLGDLTSTSHRDAEWSEVIVAPMRALEAIATKPTLTALRVALMYGMCDPITTKDAWFIFERMCVFVIGARLQLIAERKKPDFWPAALAEMKRDEISLVARMNDNASKANSLLPFTEFHYTPDDEKSATDLKFKANVDALAKNVLVTSTKLWDAPWSDGCNRMWLPAVADLELDDAIDSGALSLSHGSLHYSTVPNNEHTDFSLSLKLTTGEWHLVMFQSKFSRDNATTSLNVDAVVSCAKGAVAALDKALKDANHPYHRVGITSAKQTTLVFIALRGLTQENGFGEKLKDACKQAKLPCRVVVLNRESTKSLFGGLFKTSPMLHDKFIWPTTSASTTTASTSATT